MAEEKDDEAAHARARDRNEQLATADRALRIREKTDQRDRREKRHTRAAKAQRVTYIMREMRGQRWTKELAEAAALRFGVEWVTIRDDAAEASRRIESMTMTDPELKQELQDALDELLEIARDSARHGDMRGVEAATKVVACWSAIRGIDAPKKHDVALGASLDEVAARRRAALEAAKANE